MIDISHLDHLVLTVRDLDKTCAFYQRALGFDVVSFGDNRRALSFGNQKINLHQAGAEFKPNAREATPGSADLCFIATTPLSEVKTHLIDCGVAIEIDNVDRTGATGPITSLYIRDPDGNLIEISNY